MSRWFRHYAGLCRDEKLVGVALKAKQPVERVIWVWCAILESAAEIDNDGRYSLDAAEVAYFLRADEADILSIESGLANAARVASGSVVKWSNRQFKSDRSAERVAAHRERNKPRLCEVQNEAPLQASGVTLQKRYSNTPETELETDTERRDDAVTPAPARATALAKIEPACLALIAGTDWPVTTAQDWHALTRLAVDDGLDVDSEILPAIRQQVERARANGKRISTWGYFANGCREFARQARSPPQPMSPVTPRNFNTPGAQNAKQPTPMRAALDRLAATARGDFSPDPSNARTIDGDYTIAGSA
jgi:hypothetical protein